MIKVSIVISNYNYERFVEEAIDSALSQEYENVEVVVVDDGSTDGSRSIIEAYAGKLTCVFQENAKQGRALTAGFAACSGDVVLFLDADDTLYPGAIAAIVETFENHERVARVQWTMAVTDESGQPTGELTPDPAAMASGDLAEHVLRFRTHLWPATSGSAYARSALEALMPIPEEYEFGVDLYLAEATPFFGQVISIRTPLSTYRRHGSNVWLTRKPDGEYLRQKIAWTVRTHAHVTRFARSRGHEADDDPTKARDVAFISQRLASLRIDPRNHPIPTDTRLRLTIEGVRAALTHPHHTGLHKAKRVVWILGTGLGSARTAKKLVNRFYG